MDPPGWRRVRVVDPHVNSIQDTKAVFLGNKEPVSGADLKQHDVVIIQPMFGTWAFVACHADGDICRCVGLSHHAGQHGDQIIVVSIAGVVSQKRHPVLWGTRDNVNHDLDAYV